MIPKLPGVPSMASYGPLPSLAINALALVDLFSDAPVWGVFDDKNNKVLDPDTVIDVDFQGDSRVSDFPVEAGQFASYNKVQQPDMFRVRMSKGGTVKDREDFLAALDELKKSLKTYSLVTPEKTYLKVNVEGYDYRREREEGAGLITVDIKCREVREVTAVYTTAKPADSVKNPSSVAPSDNGDVQPKPAATSQLFKMIGKVGQK
jgi:hypothetical protein